MPEHEQQQQQDRQAPQQDQAPQDPYRALSNVVRGNRDDEILPPEVGQGQAAPAIGGLFKRIRNFFRGGDKNTQPPESEGQGQTETDVTEQQQQQGQSQTPPQPQDSSSSTTSSEVTSNDSAPKDFRAQLQEAITKSDKSKIFELLGNATQSDAEGVIGDTGLMSSLMGALNKSEQARARGSLASKLAGAKPIDAWRLLLSSDADEQRSNLEALGDITAQRALAERVIQASDDLTVVKGAFSFYWAVEMSVQTAQVDRDGDGVAETTFTPDWNVPQLRAIHSALRELPERDVRNGVWKKIILLANSAGGWMSHDGQFGLGANAGDGGQLGTLTANAAVGDTTLTVNDTARFQLGQQITIFGPNMESNIVSARDATAKTVTLQHALVYAHASGATVQSASIGTQTYGQNQPGGWLAKKANQGATVLELNQSDQFHPDETLTVDESDPSKKESVIIQSVDTTAKTVTLKSALTKNHDAYAQVKKESPNAARDVSWLAAVIRHEIGHSLDTSLGNATDDLKNNIAGWWTGTDIDTWANKMATPWTASDGTVIAGAEKEEIKTHLATVMAGAGGKPFNDGLAPTHAVNKYWSSNVPLIEAAKACTPHGQAFWQRPNDIKEYAGNVFAINHYYHTLQYCKSEVRAQRVRDYSFFSPGEFFAELYTVFYEEAGQTPAPEPGRLIPVSSWKNWLKTNIHERGHTPQSVTGEGGSVPTPKIGMKGGDPG
jgi:hypothetical protein